MNNPVGFGNFRNLPGFSLFFVLIFEIPRLCSPKKDPQRLANFLQISLIEFFVFPFFHNVAKFRHDFINIAQKIANIAEHIKDMKL